MPGLQGIFAVIGLMAMRIRAEAGKVAGGVLKPSPQLSFLHVFEEESMKRICSRPRRVPLAALSIAVLFGALLATPAAYAISSYLSSFNSLYSTSASGANASCQLCHGASLSTLNPYGAAVCGQAGSIFERLQAAEPPDSDSDPTGSNNSTEINASTQPGWTSGGASPLFSPNPTVCSPLGTTSLPPATIAGDLDPQSDGPVDLTGTVQTSDGTGICAMVLASGQFIFSCNPTWSFSLSDLPREPDGTVKRQIYAHGFFPKIDVLPDSVDETVVMTRSGTCPDYNMPYVPGVFPESAGKWIDISGRVLLQNTETPICAMVLANGQFMFSCDGSGSYALTIPLDSSGQYKLQVYADGFAPAIQTFDENQTINDVRMARAIECQ